MKTSLETVDRIVLDFVNEKSKTKKLKDNGKIGESSEYRATQQKIQCVEQIYSEFLFDEVVKRQRGFREEKEDEIREEKEKKDKDVKDKNDKKVQEHKDNLVKSIEEKKEYEDKLIEMTRKCNLNYLHFESFKEVISDEEKENFDDLLKYDNDLSNAYGELESNIKVIETEQFAKQKELADLKVELQKLKYFKEDQEKEKEDQEEPDQETAPI